jgi:hypothetical protein
MGIHESAIAQVCTAKGSVVGVAFVVTGRHLLTCAHVVNAALGAKREEMPVEQVSLVFPFLEGVPGVMARVVYWRAPRDERAIAEEDIAGLELLGEVPGILPLAPGSARVGDLCWSMGYPRNRPAGEAVWTKGVIGGPSSVGRVQIQSTDDVDWRVQKGFSGGPVLSPDRHEVLGMVTAEYDDESYKIAYMIPMEILNRAIAQFNQSSKAPSSPSLSPLVVIKQKGLQGQIDISLKQIEVLYEKLQNDRSGSEGVLIQSEIDRLTQKVEGLTDQMQRLVK